MTTQKNSKHKQFIDKNPVEAVRDLGSGITQSITKDLGQGIISNLWEQLLAGHSKKAAKKGELQEGQELDLRTNQPKHAEKTPKLDIEPGLDYRREILHVDKKVAAENNQHIQIQIQEILIELKKLASSSSQLQTQFREVMVEQRIETPGTYHVAFFEWVLTVVKTARYKVEDANSWLATFQSKKGKRQYWAMFKKHGTSFGLSNERTVATQTG